MCLFESNIFFLTSCGLKMVVSDWLRSILLYNEKIKVISPSLLHPTWGYVCDEFAPSDLMGTCLRLVCTVCPNWVMFTTILNHLS
jgi:hypothetical protein